MFISCLNHGHGRAATVEPLNAEQRPPTDSSAARTQEFLHLLSPFGFTEATAARLSATEQSLSKSYPKVFRTGTDRVVTPEQTLERVGPLAERAGVTRLADITGLDTIGIPVYSSIRPLAKNLSVSSGKGATAAAARASAMMESLEGWHSELHQVEVIEASVAQLRAASAPLVEVERIERYENIDLDLEAPMRFVAGYELISKSARLVPYEIVHGDYSLPYHPTEGVFQCGSNGLASGNVLSEAVVHALYELIERESLRTGAYDCHDPGMFGVSSSGARRIDLSSVDDSIVNAQLMAFETAGIDVAVVDCTTDLGVPSVVAMAHVSREAELRDNVINPMPFMAGAGTHLSRAIAISRALTEAAQDRAIVTAGSRDDLPRPIYTDWTGPSEFVKMVLDAPAPVSFLDMPDRANVDLCDDLADTTASVAAQGFNEIVVIDLSLQDEDSPMSAVQVVVPGMRLMDPAGPPPRPMPDVATDEPDGSVEGLDLDSLRRTGIAVFCGPTLPADLGRNLVDAAWLPPAECGDIWRAVRAGAHTIVLIDGRYSTVPAPWHKEILWALAQGVRVIGAASMGAMRSAELSRYGMVGVGEVFAMYTSGVIDGDDEVAIVHASAEDGYRQLSDALVDVRVLVAQAVEHGVVSPDQAALVVAAVRADFYPSRSLNKGCAVLDEPFCSALRAFVAPPRMRQKQADAIAALEAVSRTPPPEAPAFVDTWIWGLLVRNESSWPERH